MNKSNYRNLAVWEKARSLTVQIYRVTASFPSFEMFGLTTQMRRAAISILSNIAEGQGRWSRRDQASFIVVARGSALEIEAQLVIAADLGYVTDDTSKQLCEAATEIARMLNGLLRFMRKAAE